MSPEHESTSAKVSKRRSREAPPRSLPASTASGAMPSPLSTAAPGNGCMGRVTMNATLLAMERSSSRHSSRPKPRNGPNVSASTAWSGLKVADGRGQGLELRAPRLRRDDRPHDELREADPDEALDDGAKGR